MLKIALDFDNTLSRVEVQEKIKSLSDIRFFIITSRPNMFMNNDDIFNVAKEIGIEENDIIFTSYDDKSPYMKENNIPILLDDCRLTIDEVLNEKMIAINSTDKDWFDKLKKEIWKQIKKN